MFLPIPTESENWPVPATHLSEAQRNELRSAVKRGPRARGRGGGDPSRLMVPQSASLERPASRRAINTRLPAHEAPAPMTAAQIGSPDHLHRAWQGPGATSLGQTRAAAEPSRHADLCRSPASARFVCGQSCVDWPPRTGFRARRTRCCGTRRCDGSALPPHRFGKMEEV